MNESKFTRIPKKTRAVYCNQHIIIRIMSEVAKTVLKVIDVGLKRKVAEYVDEEQYGFNKSKV